MKFKDVEENISELSKIQGSKKIGFTFGTLTAYNRLADYYLTPIRTTPSLVYAGVVVRNVEVAIEIASRIQSVVDYLFVDSEKKIATSDYGKNDSGNIEKAFLISLNHSHVLTYKGNDLTVRAADTLLRALVSNLTGLKVAIIGVGNIGMKLGISLVERGNNVVFFSHDRNHAKEVAQLLNVVKFRTTIAKADVSKTIDGAMKDADIAIATSDKKQIISKHHVNLMKIHRGLDTRILLDVGKGCFKQETFDVNSSIYRVDIGDELSTELENLILQHDRIRNSEEIIFSNGLRFVRKGIAGKSGDYVVDRIGDSTRIIGICDDQGNLLPLEPSELARVLEIFGTNK
jgi:hypothetical protein